MKIKSILLSMFAIAALASCGSDSGGGPKGITPTGSEDGYMTLSVVKPTVLPGRATGSVEETGDAAEAKINTIYAITFNAFKNVIVATGQDPVTKLEMSGTQDKPKAIKVSSASKFLLIVANPGQELKARLDDVEAGDSWAEINEAIKSPFTPATDKTDLLVNELREIATGTKGVDATYANFTMINAGAIDDANEGLIAIAAGKIKNPEYYTGTTEEKEAAAEAAADGDRQEVMIERLTAKMNVNANNPATILPAGAQFEFKNWTLDALNSTFYPYAVKRASSTGQHTADRYDNNFYTVDPNFVNNGLALASAGLYYNQEKTDGSRERNVTWMPNNSYDYAIENTMDGPSQQFQNATRIVLKAAYYPKDCTVGDDWFSHTVSGATNYYKTLAELQTAYTAASVAATPTGAETALIEACDKFYDEVVADQILDESIITNFTELVQADHLDLVTNGGELLKDDNCIKWYQKGLNYYYYEIRHDNTLTAPMAFGKYGIVRNNFYKLTLTQVNGEGKPWYPTVDPSDPDPDGPNPPDDIDEFEGMINFDIEVGPWISWETGFQIG